MKWITGICIIIFLSEIRLPPQGEQLNWHTQYAEALVDARRQQRPVLLYFSGSDWCRPCIQMRRQLFESEAFAAYASQNLVLLELDFPRKKKNQLSPIQKQHNEALAARYNPQGRFPWVVLIRPDESLLGQFGFQAQLTPQAYLGEIRSLIVQSPP